MWQIPCVITAMESYRPHRQSRQNAPFRFRDQRTGGGNVTIVYEAETNAFAPLLAESEITNTVTVSGGGITPVTAKETVIAESI